MIRRNEIQACKGRRACDSIYELCPAAIMMAHGCQSLGDPPPCYAPADLLCPLDLEAGGLKCAVVAELVDAQR